MMSTSPELLSNTTNNTQSIMNNIDNEENDIDLKNNDNDIDEEDEYEEEEEDDFPISDVITMLTISWRNEKLAPELLNYEEEYVQRVKAVIELKEDQIDEMQQKIATSININKILSSSIYWFKKEIERIRYILHSYLRIRIWKIQKYTLHILSDIESWNKLSVEEQTFAKKYADLNELHFKNCFLTELPSKYRGVAEQEMMVKPDLNKFVVIKSNDDNDDILIENNKQHINLQKGDIFVSRYKNFKHLVSSGTVDLI